MKESKGLQFPLGQSHWEKSHSMLSTSDLKYTEGEMSNPEHLAKSVSQLAGYVKKNKMKY